MTEYYTLYRLGSWRGNGVVMDLHSGDPPTLSASWSNGYLISTVWYVPCLTVGLYWTNYKWSQWMLPLSSREYVLMVPNCVWGPGYARGDHYGPDSGSACVIVMLILKDTTPTKDLPFNKTAGNFEDTALENVSYRSAVTQIYIYMHNRCKCE